MTKRTNRKREFLRRLRGNPRMPEVIHAPDGTAYRTIRIDRTACEFHAVLIGISDGHLSHACTFSPGAHGDRCTTCPARDP